MAGSISWGVVKSKKLDPRSEACDFPVTNSIRRTPLLHQNVISWKQILRQPELGSNTVPTVETKWGAAWRVPRVRRQREAFAVTKATSLLQARCRTEVEFVEF